MMNQKSIASSKIENSITSEDILGKEVIDTDGTIIGVVERVLIDPSNIEMVGISIDKGFLTKGLTLGKNYIEEITTHAVLLKIRVAYEIKGKRVFDSDGMIIGRVRSIELEDEKNILSSINISDGPIFKKLINVDARLIKTIGEGVMLTLPLSEIKGK